MPRRLSSQVCCFITAFGLSFGALAAELGEPKVSSHIGQQLVADIELTAIEDAAAPMQVRLASGDVYRGASIDMPAVLSSLTMNVMRRDGKQFLHVTSLKPVDSDHLHLFLELNEGGHRSVRLATLWLTPDPMPPAPPVQRPAPVVAAPVEATPPPLPKKTAQSRPAPATAEAAPAPLPKKAPHPRPAPVAAASPEPKVAPLPWQAPQLPAVPVQLAKAPVAPACKPQPTAQPQPDPVCAALDHKNADLRAQVAKLEEKVKSLQDKAKRSLAAVPAKVAAPAEKAPVRLRPVKQGGPAPVQPQAQPSGLPWDWIAGAGAAVFVLVGAGRFLRTRRAKASPKARAKRRLMQDDANPTEPTLG